MRRIETRTNLAREEAMFMLVRELEVCSPELLFPLLIGRLSPERPDMAELMEVLFMPGLFKPTLFRLELELELTRPDVESPLREFIPEFIPPDIPEFMPLDIPEFIPPDIPEFMPALIPGFIDPIELIPEFMPPEFIPEPPMPAIPDMPDILDMLVMLERPPRFPPPFTPLPLDMPPIELELIPLFIPPGNRV